jgi:hypothetical protein
VKNKDMHHASLTKRVAYVESSMSDSADLADMHARALESVHTKIKQLHHRIVDERTHREKHESSLDCMKKAHIALQSDIQSNKDTLDRRHASASEHMEYLEKLLGDSADKHARELEAASAAHARLENNAGSSDVMHGSHADRIHQLAREMDAMMAHHASVGERLDCIERTTGDSANKHEIKAVSQAHGKHTKELDTVKKAHVHHASMEQRLNYMEKMMGDSVDKQAQNIAAAHARVDQLHGQLVTIETHQSATGDHLKNILKERFVDIKQMIGDSADKHVKALDSQRSAHGTPALDLKGRDAHRAILVERVDYLEKALGDLADNYVKNHTSMSERIEYLETNLIDSAENIHAHNDHGFSGRIERIEHPETNLRDLGAQLGSIAASKDEIESVQTSRLLMEERHKRHVLIKQTTKMWTITRASRQAEMDALTATFETKLKEAREQSQLDLLAWWSIDARDDNNDLDHHNNDLDDDNGLDDNNGGATTEATARKRISLDKLTPPAGCGPWHQEPGRAHAPGLRPATVGHKPGKMGRNGPRTRPWSRAAAPTAHWSTHLRPIGRPCVVARLHH